MPNSYEEDGGPPERAELSAELTKFAIGNASKDPSTLEAAVCITAHNFVDEDGDDALNFEAISRERARKHYDLSTKPRRTKH